MNQFFNDVLAKLPAMRLNEEEKFIKSLKSNFNIDKFVNFMLVRNVDYVEFEYLIDRHRINIGIHDKNGKLVAYVPYDRMMELINEFFQKENVDYRITQIYESTIVIRVMIKNGGGARPHDPPA
jgi:hypothetical protein